MAEPTLTDDMLTAENMALLPRAPAIVSPEPIPLTGFDLLPQPSAQLIEPPAPIEAPAPVAMPAPVEAPSVVPTPASLGLAPVIEAPAPVPLIGSPASAQAPVDAAVQPDIAPAATPGTAPAPAPTPALEFEPEPVATTPEQILSAPLSVDPEASAAEVERLQFQGRNLRTREAELMAQYAQAATDEQRAELGRRITDIRVARTGIDGAVQEARAKRDEDLALAAAESQVRATRAALAARQAQDAELARIQTEADARTTALKSSETEARAKLDQDREAYRKVLQQGPEPTTRDAVLTIASMIGETFRAMSERRPVDFSRIIADFDKRNQAAWQAQVDAALDRVSQGTDGIERQAAQAREIEAQTRSRRAAFLDEAERKLETMIAGSGSELERARLVATRDAVRQEREGAYAQALAASQDQALKRRQLEQDMALKDAQTRKALADAGIAERKARGGVGSIKATPPDLDPQLAAIYQQDKKEAARIAAQAIRHPVTGQILKQPDGRLFTAATTEEAREVRKVTSNVRSAYDLAQEIIALREAHGYEPGFAKTEAWQTMQSKAKTLSLLLKDAFQTGALDKGSIEILDAITGGDATAILSTTPSLKTLIGNLETIYGNTLGAQGFQGEFKLPEITPPARPTLDDVGTKIDRPFDPRSGTVLAARERLSLIDEEVDLLRGRTDSNALATEISIENNQRRMDESVARRRRMQDDLVSAIDAGDRTRAASLRKSLQEEQEFQKALDERLVRDQKRIKEQEREDRKRRQAPRPDRPAGGRVGEF